MTSQPVDQASVSSSAVQAGQDTLSAGTRAAVFAFRAVGAPLLAAVLEVRALAPDDGTGRRQEEDASIFAQLLTTTGDLVRMVSAEAGIGPSASDDAPRLTLAAAASAVVAAHYRATGNASLPLQAKALMDAIRATASSAGGPAENPPGTGEVFAQTRLLRAMAPVLAAVSRYAFGRPEPELLAMVATRLGQKATDLTGKLCPPDAGETDRHLMYATAMEVAGWIYAESHHVEADRLVDMTPEERSAYVAKNNNQIPLDPVWTKFEQNLAMLVTLVQSLKAPGDAGLDALDMG
ncbi:MAG: hypothetical protein M3O22_03480 [Pseudomonadota bacterium]|nr:hypothetical protein [Pseudomonadota bacterium]